jgi:hypothetical protein
VRTAKIFQPLYLPSISIKILRRQPRPQRRIARRPFAIDNRQHIAVAGASFAHQPLPQTPFPGKPSRSAARREARFIESHFHSSRR